ncbi:MAG: PorT family protein [Candidatus Krumholzibacteriota bacterium]|nr:PorT family protein [Candidatus Krumholzibacteriota bacterium]
MHVERRLIAVGLALTCVAGFAAPEVSYAGAKEAILWGGAVTSDVFGSDGESLGGGSRSSYTVGMSLMWKLHRNVGIELGGRYTQKGSKGNIDTRYSDEDTTTGVIVNATVELNYIEVPLLVAGIFPVGEKSELRGYAGISANFLVTSQITGTLNNQFFDAPAENVNGIDWAGVVGFSYEYRMDTASVVFDLRFIGSLQSIEDSPDLDFDVKLRAFEFAVGLGIPLGEGHF